MRINSLDSVRGIAALVVVFSHLYAGIPAFNVDHLWVFNYTPLSFLIDGRFSVLIFFILSGFVLSLPFIAGKQDYWPYVIRRVCRIWLPFVFAIFGATLLYAYFSTTIPQWEHTEHYFPKSLPISLLLSHLLMSGVGVDCVSLDHPMWSLIIEMRVSLIFPLLFLFLKRTSWLGLVVLIIAGIVSIKVSAFLGTFNNTFSSTTLTGSLLLTGYYIPLFGLGIMIALHRNQLTEAFARIPMSVQLGLVLMMVLIPNQYTKAHNSLKDIYDGLLAAYLIMCCLICPRLDKVLSLKPFRWLGKVSYSMYLIHAPIGIGVRFELPVTSPYVALSLAFPMVLVASDLMHTYIEVPAVVLGKKLAAIVGK
jgi:peptidoglycan/LPS O-acetylase OafA/YrhL